MNEFQGALGLVQLTRLEYILEKQKKNKKEIKQALKQTPNITFRKFVDEKGEAGDTLAFSLESAKDAKIFFDKLTEAKIGTKILQESYKWHFAGTWDHMLPQYPQYKHPEKLWRKSASILDRTIALPIMVKMDDARINYVADTVDKIARSL
jgi:8-amino-3,8-dideoxy-alpha-D-manno-octulosonate transaminase